MTITISMRQMLEAGVHFGHQKRFWNAKMAPYIYGEREKLHIINLEETLPKFQELLELVSKIASKRGKILFVGTKYAARDVIKEESIRCGMPYVNHRWLGGMLTNYKTIRQSIRRLKDLEAALENPKLLSSKTKKEVLMLQREKDKLANNLDGIKNMGGLPDLLFVIDVKHEKTAVQEANRLSIPVAGIVDTNSSPDDITYVVPGNDDAIRAIRFYCKTMADVIIEARRTILEEEIEKEKVKAEKAKTKAAQTKVKTAKKIAPKVVETVTAVMVKELREMTGAGMMECKKALETSGGDLQLAVDNMRKSGQAKAAKRAGRIAAEGVVVVSDNDTHTEACMLEVNCETDFVARDENFKKFAHVMVNAGLKANVTEVPQLMTKTLSSYDNMTAEKARESLVSKTGENIQVRRMALLKSQFVGQYLHGDRIGVLVALDQVNPELAKDIAMHIAAMNPLAVTAEGLSKELLERERDIAMAQSQSSGKAPAIVEKMVDGRIQKFIKEVCLVHQIFVKNPDQTIGDLLQSAKAKVTGFVRFEVGEGIEKQTVDLAKEVSETLKGSV